MIRTHPGSAVHSAEMVADNMMSGIEQPTTSKKSFIIIILL